MDCPDSDQPEVHQADLHQSVLQEQAVAYLVTNRDGYYVDATYGRGGHSKAILHELSSQANLLVMDRDTAAIDHARSCFGQDGWPRFR